MATVLTAVHPPGTRCAQSRHIRPRLRRAGRDMGGFLTATHAWVDAFAGSLRGQGVAIDGKTLRGSFDRAAGQSPLHTITALACDTRLCLRQMSVGENSNEILAVNELITLMELSGATVTLDAMHCKVETAQAVIDADYDLIVIGNQQGLHHDLLDRVIEYGEADYQVKGFRRHTTVETSHGRRERREYYAISAPWNDTFLRRWPELRSVGMVHRRRGPDTAFTLLRKIVHIAHHLVHLAT